MILTSILHAEVSVEFSVIYEEQSVCDSTCVPGVEFADWVQGLGNQLLQTIVVFDLRPWYIFLYCPIKLQWELHQSTSFQKMEIKTKVFCKVPFTFEVIITLFPLTLFLFELSHILLVFFQIHGLFFIRFCYMHICIHIYVPKYNVVSQYNVNHMYIFRYWKSNCWYSRQAE